MYAPTAGPSLYGARILARCTSGLAQYPAQCSACSRAERTPRSSHCALFTARCPWGFWARERVELQLPVALQAGAFPRVLVI
jgi:hypothetical protein